MIIKKQFLKILFFLILYFSVDIISAQTWVTWNNQASLATSMTGTATVAGQTVTVTVTSSTNSTPTGTWNADNDATLASGNNWGSFFGSLGSIQTNLGVVTANQFIISRHTERAKPTVLTISVDKDVVIKTLAFSDINADPWNDGHTITGYTFTGQTNGGWSRITPTPTVTNQSLTFAAGTNSSTSAVGDGWMKHTGSNVITAGSSFTVNFHYWTALSLNHSNKNNFLAIELCPATTISTQPSSSTVCLNTSTTLSVAANNATSYQWFAIVPIATQEEQPFQELLLQHILLLLLLQGLITIM